VQRFERAEWGQVICAGFAAVISGDLQQHNLIARTVWALSCPRPAPTA